LAYWGGITACLVQLSQKSRKIIQSPKLNGGFIAGKMENPWLAIEFFSL
jgi:hypothetical protein